MLNLSNKRFMIYGLQGSGKTVLAKFILRNYQHFVYDTLHEYQGFDRYLPQYSRGAVDPARAELNLFVNRKVLIERPNLFFIDEINRYCPTKPVPLPEAIGKLNDWSRHYGIAWGGAARRPTQVHSDLTELAHVLFIFVLKGKNDTSYLNDVVRGLGDTVAELEQYHFVMVDESRNIQVMSPCAL